MNITLEQALAIVAALTKTDAPPPQCHASPERPVIVTTAHRGVFFGYATDVHGETISLKRSRNCLYWPVENKGFIGLATMGPVKGSRVGPPADIQLRNITSVVEASPDAVKAWEGSPWSK